MRKNKLLKAFVVVIIASLMATMALIPASAADEREFPEWATPIPNWFLKLDPADIPDWFFELPSEPNWYRQVPDVPSWFFDPRTDFPSWWFTQTITPEAPVTTPGDTPIVPEIPEPEVPVVKMYTYAVPNSIPLVTNIPKGFITDGEVILDFEVGIMIVMRADSFFPYTPGQPLAENGVYKVVMADNYELEIFNFTIANGPVNFLSVYTAPEGFTIVEALFAGNPKQISDNKRFEMNADGDYKFTVVDKDFEAFYTVGITLLTALPSLTFSQITDDGEVELVWAEDGVNNFEGPIVYFSPDMEDYSIYVFYNRSAITAPHNHTLREAGRYHVNVVDAAGNLTRYTFRILYVLDVPTVWIIVVSVIFVAVLTTYLILNRKKARVR